MREFTLDIYELILKSFSFQGYVFSTFEEYVLNHKNKVVILKHDVDKLPKNALRMANLEKRLGIKTSYYFRTIDRVYDESIIEKIAGLGHEVSYHYEDLTIAKGDYNKAIQLFEKNLKKIRKFCPAKTICMHGSPLSKFDNQKIWEKFDYRDYGIIADCYLDVDFDEVFYITDTGRSWNKSTASVRDKVVRAEDGGPRLNPLRSSSAKNLTGQAEGRTKESGFRDKLKTKFDITIKDTHDLIEKIQNNELPDKIMMNVHPQRWDNRFGP
jgi:hypothetical protein